VYYHTIYNELLGWPAGIIVGNLIASVIWSALFEWRLGVHRRKTDRSVNAKFAWQNEKMETQHKALKEHIDAQHTALKDHIDSRISYGGVI
jgi:hypothetical protein